MPIKERKILLSDETVAALEEYRKFATHKSLSQAIEDCITSHLQAINFIQVTKKPRKPTHQTNPHARLRDTLDGQAVCSTCNRPALLFAKFGVNVTSCCGTLPKEAP